MLTLFFSVQQNVIASTSVDIANRKGRVFCKDKTKAEDETYKITEQTVNKFISGDATPISGRSAGIRHNSFKRWKFDDIGSEEDGESRKVTKDPTVSVGEVPRKDPTIGYNTNDFQGWHVGKKSKGREKIGAKETFTGKDKMSRRKAGISRSLEDNTKYAQPQKFHSSRISEDNQRLGHAVETVVTTKRALSWQSLMAAGKCRLAELSIPGYDEFLMKTKRYELAENSKNVCSTDVFDSIVKTLSMKAHFLMNSSLLS